MTNFEELTSVTERYLKEQYNDIKDIMFLSDVSFMKDSGTYIIKAFVSRNGYDPMVFYKIEIKNNSVENCIPERDWNDIFKSSKIFEVDKDVKEKLDFFDTTLMEFDNKIEEIKIKIQNNIINNDIAYSSRIGLLQDIDFKINETYSLFIDLINSIYDLTFIYYRTYYGPFKDINMKNVPFVDTAKGSEAITKISYLFDSFLVQFISLLDYMTKLICQTGNFPNLNNIDSYPGLINIKKNIIELTKDEEDIQNIFLQYQDEMTEIRFYRNAMVHQKCIPKNHSTKRVDSFFFSDLSIPNIRKKNRDRILEFDVSSDNSPKSGHSLISYVTYAYYKLLLLIIKSLKQSELK